MTPSPAELIGAFDALLREFPTAQRRQMFGYPAAFANGYMLTSLYEEGWVVRLPETDRAQLREQTGAVPFEPMAGRPMKEFLVFPSDLVGDPERLRPWIDRALAHVLALPAKQPRRRCRRSG